MESAYFDSKSPKYQTCFCHVKTATACICAFYFIMGFVIVIIGANLFPEYALYFIPALIILPLIFLSPLYAIYSTTSGWLLPVISLTGLVILLNIATFMLKIIGSKDLILNQQVTGEMAYKLLGQLFSIFISIWFFCIFCKCYGYLKAKRNAKKFQHLAMSYQINALNSMYPPNIYAPPYETYPQQF